jgi:hypothetical protein
MKKLLKSKTMLFSLALAVLGAVQASWGVLDDYLSPKAAGLAAVAVAILVAVLRVLTTEPLSDK